MCALHARQAHAPVKRPHAVLACSWRAKYLEGHLYGDVSAYWLSLPEELAERSVFWAFKPAAIW